MFYERQRRDTDVSIDRLTYRSYSQRQKDAKSPKWPDFFGMMDVLRKLGAVRDYVKTGDSSCDIIEHDEHGKARLAVDEHNKHGFKVDCGRKETKTKHDAVDPESGKFGRRELLMELCNRQMMFPYTIAGSGKSEAITVHTKLCYDILKADLPTSKWFAAQDQYFAKLKTERKDVADWVYEYTKPKADERYPGIYLKEATDVPVLVEDIMFQVKEAIVKAPVLDKAITVWRGISNYTAVAKTWVADPKTGRVFWFCRNYTSSAIIASVSVAFAHYKNGAMFKILLPVGTPALYIGKNSFFTDEVEILLCHKSVFEIIAVEKQTCFADSDESGCTTFEVPIFIARFVGIDWDLDTERKERLAVLGDASAVDKVLATEKNIGRLKAARAASDAKTKRTDDQLLATPLSQIFFLAKNFSAATDFDPAGLSVGDIVARIFSDDDPSYAIYLKPILASFGKALATKPAFRNKTHLRRVIGTWTDGSDTSVRDFVALLIQGN